MPCYDSRHDEHPSGEAWSTRAERLEKRCDELASLLCEAVGYMDAHGMLSLGDGSPELRAWWEEHKKFDRERQERPRSKKR